MMSEMSGRLAKSAGPVRSKRVLNLRQRLMNQIEPEECGRTLKQNSPQDVAVNVVAQLMCQDGFDFGRCEVFKQRVGQNDSPRISQPRPARRSPFLVFSLNFHSNTPCTRVPARRQSSERRSIKRRVLQRLELEKDWKQHYGRQIGQNDERAERRLRSEMTHQCSGQRRSVP